MHIVKILKTVSASCLFLAIAGCCPSPTGFVGEQTSQAVRELAIVPVFPFRENFHVGDIYEDPYAFDDLNSTKPDSPQAGVQKIGMWLHSLDVTQELKAFYATRLSFPPTTSPTFAVDNVQSADQTLTRLRIVAFPSFAEHSISSSEISAVVPVKTAASISAAAGSAAQSTTSLSVPEAESYGLPADLVMTNLQSVNPAVWLAIYHGFQSHKSDKDPTNNDLYIRVVTEVYYARSIDLNISAAAGTTFGLTAKVNPGLLGGTAAVPTVGAPPIAAAPASGATATDLTAALQADLAKNGGDTAPGVKFTYTAASDTSITLKATFDQPVAIGFRGFVAVIDHNGKLTLDGTANGAHPSFTIR